MSGKLKKICVALVLVLSQSWMLHAQLSEHITAYANAVTIARDKLVSMGMA